mgnify:CR=1 FL=1
MFADLVDTDGTGRSASLMTYEKVSRGVTRPCNVSSKCPKQSPFGTVLRGGGGEDGEAFVLREAGRAMNMNDLKSGCLDRHRDQNKRR